MVPARIVTVRNAGMTFVYAGLGRFFGNLWWHFGQPHSLLAFAIAAIALAGNTGCSKKIGGVAPSEAVDEPLAAAKAVIDLQADLDSGDRVIIAAANRALDARFGPLRDFQRLADQEQGDLAGILDERVQSAFTKVEGENALHDKFVTNEFEPAWKKAAAERQRVASARDQFEREERKAQQTALALGTEHRWFWLASLVAVAALLAMFVVDQRHEVRRYLNGGRAKGLALGKVLVGLLAMLVVLTVSLFFASDGILVDWLDRSGGATAAARIAESSSADAEKTAELRTRQSTQRKELESLREKLETEFGRIVPAKAAVPLFDRWWAYWEAATKRRAQLQSLEQCQARFDADLAAIKHDETAIATARDATEKWRLQANRLCGFIGVGLTSLVGIGAVMFARGVKGRARKLANTCPLCLTEGSLKEAGDGDGGGQQLAEGMVRCEAVISESPFEECRFDFPSMFRPVPKVCFPTLGIPQAGKTHWLAMVYRELNKGNFPKEVEFAKIRSSSSDDFERIVDDILVSKSRPGATQTSSMPRPLVFNFRDHDGLGRSNILVNIFDYSGEVLRSMTLEDHQRKRAFTADGYFFFLDPTEPSDVQTQPLANFRQDVRTVKGLQAGQQIRCPVALCVPKIDLMPDEDYARGGNIVDKFYDDLRDIGWGMDEGSIKKRSELMRRLRDDIWPGWEIERQIDDLFGGRYMFFPLSPVGLNEPGERDLAKRTIAPVGILHPLMWLLHMNGYPVLGSGK
jgi:hypothetical protein